jgi:hypothetical protein
MLLSVFSLAGCRKKPQPVQTGSIDGKTPNEIYEEAIGSREEIRKTSGYKVVLDVEFKVHVVFVDIPVGSDGIYEYSYQGENAHHKLSDDAIKLFENKYVKQVVGDDFVGLNKEMWYVDGVYYCVKSDDTLVREETETNPIEKNVLELAIDDIVGNHIDKAVCYEQGSEKYFEIIVTGEDMYLGKFSEEIYHIYFTDESKIDKIVVTGKGENYECSVVGTYTYDIPPIEAPNFVISE